MLEPGIAPKLPTSGLVVDSELIFSQLPPLFPPSLKVEPQSCVAVSGVLWKRLCACVCVQEYNRVERRWHGAWSLLDHTFKGEQLLTKVPPLLLSFITQSSIYLEQICLPCFKNLNTQQPLLFFLHLFIKLYIVQCCKPEVHLKDRLLLFDCSSAAWAHFTVKPVKVWYTIKCLQCFTAEQILPNVKIFRKCISG